MVKLTPSPQEKLSSKSPALLRLKEDVEKLFKKAKASIENKTEENIQEYIQSVTEILKKKIAVIKTLEDEIADLESHTKQNSKNIAKVN